MSRTDLGPRRLTDHLVAAFVTFHLVVVAIHLIPTPPRTDDAALAIPEVAQEIDRVVRAVHGAGLYDGTQDALRDDLIAAVRAYRLRLADATWFTRVYLSPLGSQQSWNMFGGNAKAHPKVMVVEIRPRGEEDYVPFQDGRWGGTFVEHRHRKVRRNLSLRGDSSRRRQYSAWLARQWDEAHPDRPAAWVYTYYVVRHTPTARQVRSGAPERPEEREFGVAWKVR